MPTLLAIESSGESCSLALLHQNILQEQCFLQARRHNQVLLPAIKSLLAERQLSVTDIDALLVSIGPGSFTGLRMAIASAQALAFAADCPVLPLSSLHCLAQETMLSGLCELQLNKQQALWVLEDARMEEIYLGQFSCSQQHVAVLQADRLLNQSQLQALLEQQVSEAAEPVLWCGNVAEVCKANLPAELALKVECLQSTVRPRARALMMLGQQRAVSDGLDAAGLQPVYLREEINWQKWQKKAEQFSNKITK